MIFDWPWKKEVNDKIEPALWILDDSKQTKAVIDVASTLPLYVVGRKNGKILTLPMESYLKRKSIAAAIIVDAVAYEIEKA